MAKASQAVILENEFYIIKAPNGNISSKPPMERYWK